MLCCQYWRVILCRCADSRADLWVSFNDVYCLLSQRVFVASAVNFSATS
nr:hypothetical protein HMPREF0276_0531 [Corynebacterium accolens ATCC 49725]